MNDALGGRNKTKVSYYYNDDIGNYQFNQGHPMKPFRVKMTDSMIKAYGIDKDLIHMEIDQDYIDNVDFTMFHSDDYIDILKNLTLDNKDFYTD